jgi:4-hydroxybenzoate polyprenyltransferase
MKRWHAWLELARISNLPTVWTNVLAGWLLAGGQWHWAPLAWLLAGGSLMYTAGMILNDAMDVRFDREHRQERPIPSGRISLPIAWGAGAGMLIAGAALCYFGAGSCGWLVLALAAAIVVYDAFHKPWAGSVLVMGSCRTLLYLLAGSAVTGGPKLSALVDLPEVARALAAKGFNAGDQTVRTIEAMHMDELFPWIAKAVAIGGYIVGLSLVARSESTGGKGGALGRGLGMLGLFFPILTVPISICFGPYYEEWLRSSFVWLAVQAAMPVVFLVLVFFALKLMRTPPPSNIGRAVGLLLAGIVVVDAMAISIYHPMAAVVFAASMPLLLLWQRKIAAT